MRQRPVGDSSPRSSRRSFLQLGYSSLLGLGIPSLLRDKGLAESGSRVLRRCRAKSVLLVFVTGGPSQLDTFDPKPDAPVEVRGDFAAIATRTPGLIFSEHLPRLANSTDRLAVIRTLALRQPGLAVHQPATHLMLTGRDALPPGAQFLNSRHDWPCFASAINYLRPHDSGLPTGVMLPTYLNDAGIGYSGQDAGLLGAQHDPWHIRSDPSKPDFKVDGLSMPIEISFDRLGGRRELLDNFDRQRRSFDALNSVSEFQRQQSVAFNLLTSGVLAKALDLTHESNALRDRYGRHLMGQSLLLARRLVETGMPIVQVNMGVTAQWDTHTSNCDTLKKSLLPPFDQSVSALLEDLSDRGLLADTFVAIVGEFGRTPKLGGNLNTPTYSPSGRDHWTDCFSGLFAGAGVQGGRVIGTSDRMAAYPLDEPFYPSDIGATIYDALGIDPANTIPDQFGRPLRLCEGNPIRQLFAG